MLNAPGRVKRRNPAILLAPRRLSSRPHLGRCRGTTPGATCRSAMRALAIDLGKVRVGVAVSDELGLLAHPRPHLDGRNRRSLFEALEKLATDEGASVLIVGLPRELKGGEGLAARRARKFAEELAAKTGRRVELIDEWLSTREARARLHEQGLKERELRGKVDSAAAAVLLQSWLDSRARQRPEP
jgi:putative Holliday junction resolvase